ncbi:CheR family methyltransferase [Maritalea mediterranea]|uniref:Chemotaxis protein methyltransferase n=1 Tax=Maritalea mediterranea TaxID=2909667 RepID=A0ABS9E718_9HYPH|nr:protein-glutamate O-methyltransferase CheR [Maritalea mediterranea]MCF4097560.1 protein-glutamate O-methyltransferase CheR [Maritalea mediterranea]
MDNGEISLSDREFEAVRNKVYKLAGISMSDAKRTLVVSRLSKIVRRLNLQTFSDYIDFLDRNASADDIQEFINALTTNLTRFYREDHHFDHLVDHVGNLMKDPKIAASKRLRIWSAGCSTGQEPYTIAMALLSAFPQLKSWDMRILATDIDTDVVRRAQTGVYKENDLAGLSAERSKFFEPLGNGDVQIPEFIRKTIAFKPLNLMHEWPMKGPFDAIFCRNVAIYFNKPTQERMFTRMGELLAPHGFLYIGHSENLNSVSEKFKLVGKTIYKPKSEPASRSAA